MNIQRPLSVIIAVVLLGLFSVMNLAFPLFPTEGIPAFVVYSGVALGIIGLVATAGLWMLRKWSIWLTIIVAVLNILAAAPGIAGAPNGALQAAATATVIAFALVAVLVVLPASRKAHA